MTTVVVHHAHHPDEGVYRLVHAEEVEHIRHVSNPDFDPSKPPSDDNPFEIQARFKVYMNHQEIVWHAEDPRWEEMTDEEIAETQRREVTEAIARRASIAKEEEDETQQRSAQVRHFETGQSLV